MNLRADDYWTILTAIFCGVACAVPGCFLVLRRMSLLGDAISHAILPGLVLAFVLTGSRAAVPMLIGAMLVGLLTALLSSVLNRWGKVPEDAAMGVVFTSLFAIGVLLIARYASQVDLDPGCVLYGLIEFTPLDRIPLLGIDIPRATLLLSLVAGGNLLLLLLFYKELKIVSFDGYLATTLGINATLVHYCLMAVVAATTVASFESVGSILVVTMLIAPGATAHLLTDRLSRMIVWASGIATASAILGYLLALHWNTSVAGMMSVVAGVFFATAAFFAPRHGYLSKVLHQAVLSLRIVREDVIAILYRWQENGQTEPLDRESILSALGRGLLPRIALWLLARKGQIVAHRAGGITLTPVGADRARGLVRSHRLWESYLNKRLGLPADHVHAPAERVEHFVGPELRDRLAEEVGKHPDPHGRAIPQK